MAATWLQNAMRSEPYAVERVQGTDDKEAKFRATRFDDSPQPAVSSGPPQSAPPLIPSTVEQQARMGAGAAEQYGGARPWNNLGENETRADPATLAMIALALGGAWMMLRQK